MTAPLFAYYAPEADHTVESIQETLLRTQLDECWLRIRPTTVKRAGEPLLMLQMYNLRTGAPRPTWPASGSCSPPAGGPWSWWGPPTRRPPAPPSRSTATARPPSPGPVSWRASTRPCPTGSASGVRTASARPSPPRPGWAGRICSKDAERAGVASDEANPHTDLLLRGRVVGLPAGAASAARGLLLPLRGAIVPGGGRGGRHRRRPGRRRGRRARRSDGAGAAGPAAGGAPVEPGARRPGAGLPPGPRGGPRRRARSAESRPAPGHRGRAAAGPGAAPGRGIRAGAGGLRAARHGQRHGLPDRRLGGVLRPVLLPAAGA